MAQDLLREKIMNCLNCVEENKRGGVLDADAILSGIRKNCIDWIPEEKEKIIVELGAGFGELTKTLYKKSKKIYSFERNKEKADIIRYRYQDIEGIKVIEGNLWNSLEGVSWDQVSYVVVHNIEELFDTASELESLIRIVRGRLHNGCLILICENRFGIANWSGREINGRAAYQSLTDSNCRLLTKKSIHKMLCNSGYSNVKFYYPYPNEMACKYIFSDGFYPQEEMISNRIWSWRKEESGAFDENLVLRNLVTQHYFEEFSNAYICIAGEMSWKQQDWPLFVKYSNGRKRIFAIETSIDASKTVRKRAMFPCGKGHIQNMVYLANELSKQYDGIIGVSACKVEHDTAVNEYVDGKSLKNTLLDDYEREDESHFFSIFDTYVSRVESANDNGFFCQSDEFKRVFGDVNLPSDLRCGTYCNLDLIFDNVIQCEDSSWSMIDNEWLFDFPIPIKFVIYRTILYFFNDLPLDAKREAWKMRCYERVGITETMIEQFGKMERSFQAYVAT